MRKIGLYLLTIITVIGLTGCGEDKSGNSSAGTEASTVQATTVESKAEETSTAEKIEFDDKFYGEKEKYEKFLKENYGGEPTADSESVFSYNVTDDKGESIAGLGLIYYMDSSKADKYMDYISKSFPAEKQSKYESYEDSLVYTPDKDSKDSNGEKLPAFIFIRVGNAIWNTYFYDGNKNIAEDFLKSMVEENK